jgi:DNA polymerase IV
LREGKYLGRRITLKLRYADFTTPNHQRSLDYFTNDEEYIFKVAEKCFREIFSPGSSIRLIGIRISHLQKTSDSYSIFQQDLFHGEIASKKNLVLKAADTIRDKYGDNCLFYAGTF